jgi:hypothetical protein
VKGRELEDHTPSILNDDSRCVHVVEIQSNFIQSFGQKDFYKKYIVGRHD